MRSPQFIYYFAFLWLAVAAVSARLAPLIDERVYPYRSFEYDPAPSDAAVNKNRLDELKRTMLAGTDPREMLFYVSLFHQNANNRGLAPTLTAAERQRCARWLTDPDTIVTAAAFWLATDLNTEAGQARFNQHAFTPGRIFQQRRQQLLASQTRALQSAPELNQQRYELAAAMGVGPGEFDPEQSRPRTVITSRRELQHALESQQDRPERQSDLLEWVFRDGNEEIVRECLVNQAGPSLQQLFCRRGPPLRRNALGYSGGVIDPNDLYLETIMAWKRQGRQLGLSLADAFDKLMVVSYHLPYRLDDDPNPRKGEQGRVPLQERIGLVNSRHPQLQYIGWTHLLRVEQGRQTFDHEGDAAEAATLPLGQLRSQWESALARRRSFLFELLNAMSFDEFVNSGYRVEAVRYETEIPAGAELISEETEDVIRRLDRLHLDERTADFSLPDERLIARELRPLYARARLQIGRDGYGFESLWAVAKLSYFVNHDLATLEMLYRLEQDPAHRARILKFIFRLPVNDDYLSLLGAINEVNRYEGGQNRMKAATNVWEVGPGPDLLTEVVKSFIGSSRIPDEGLWRQIETWIDKTALTPEQIRRLYPLYGQVDWGDQNGHPDKNLVNLIQAAEELPPPDKRAFLREIIEKTRVPAWRLWCAMELVRHGETVGPELGWEYRDCIAAYGDSAPMAYRLLYETLGPDRFPYREFDHFCIVYPELAATLFAEEPFFTRGANPQTHEFLETLAGDLLRYGTDKFNQLRQGLIREMDRLNLESQDYWRIPPPRMAAEDDWSETSGQFSLIVDRMDYKSIELAGAVDAFWELYRQKPDELWAMEPPSTGPRVLMRFINDPAGKADRVSRLDELLTHNPGEEWIRSVAAEKAIGSAGLGGIKGYPVARIGKLSNPPTLDGDIKPGEWQSAARLEPGDRAISGPSLPTAVSVGYTGEGLYLACEAGDRPERIDAQTYDIDGPFYQRESFSFFIDVQRLYRRMIALNVDYWGNIEVVSQETSRSGGDVRRQTRVGWRDGRWQAELFLPWAELKMTIPAPAPGDIWRFNFRRNQFDGTIQNSYQWVKMPKNPYQPEYYGFIRFE